MNLDDIAAEVIGETVNRNEAVYYASVLRNEVRRRLKAADAAAAAIVVAEEKRCPGCEQTKPVSAYGKNSSRADGLQVRCRECRRPPTRVTT